MFTHTEGIPCVLSFCYMFIHGVIRLAAAQPAHPSEEYLIVFVWSIYLVPECLSCTVHSVPLSITNKYYCTAIPKVFVLSIQIFYCITIFSCACCAQTCCTDAHSGQSVKNWCPPAIEISYSAIDALQAIWVAFTCQSRLVSRVPCRHLQLKQFLY